MKALARQQVGRRKAPAVRFTRDDLGDSDRAAEIEDESLEGYAERRHFQIRNPERVKPVAVPTRRELFSAWRTYRFMMSAASRAEVEPYGSE